MEKYGSIDALNEAWGTNFWNQTYNSFEEVYVPRTTLSNNTNPHEVLDYTRFVSDSACKFAKLQSDIIRKYIKPVIYHHQRSVRQPGQPENDKRESGFHHI